MGRGRAACRCRIRLRVKTRPDGVLAGPAPRGSEKRAKGDEQLAQDRRDSGLFSLLDSVSPFAFVSCPQAKPAALCHARARWLVAFKARWCHGLVFSLCRRFDASVSWCRRSRASCVPVILAIVCLGLRRTSCECRSCALRHCLPGTELFRSSVSRFAGAVPRCAGSHACSCACSCRGFPQTVPPFVCVC